VDVGIAEALITGGSIAMAAFITGFFAWRNARAARASAAKVEEQVTPTNGTRLAEYIERTDGRLEHLIELVMEARDAAKDAATSTELHEAKFRHEEKE
jgi:hypothetical protein